jgi:hypothetical protein
MVEASSVAPCFTPPRTRRAIAYPKSANPIIGRNMRKRAPRSGTTTKSRGKGTFA